MIDDRALIAEGRQVVKEVDNRQWRLGDLAITYARAIGPHGLTTSRVGEYAAEIGLEAGMLHSYVRVALAYDQAERTAEIPWTCYRDLATRDDRHTVMTAFIAHCAKHAIKTGHYRELQKFDGRKPTAEFAADRVIEQGTLALERMPTAEAVRLAQGVLTRTDVQAALPAVLAEVARAQPAAFREALKTDPHIRQEMAAAQVDIWNARNAGIERRAASNPTLRNLAEGDALLDLTEAVNDFTHRVEEIWPRLGNVPAEDAGGLDLGASRMLRETLERAEESLAKVRNFVTHGKSDLESFLGSVLKGVN
jgi:hypothetical protein